MWKIFCLAASILVISCSARGDETKFTLKVGGAQIDVTVAAGKMQLSQAEITRWVQNAAESVTAYYGHFPVPHPSIQIKPFAGRGVRSGRTFGEHGGFISIRLGSETTVQELASDWMLTHEMVHLTFPDMPDRNHWIEEGIATYVEPIARIQAGHLDAPSMWADLVRDMPNGLPAAGDQGLDNTHTWGRTYWGGALFCLLADVQIRRETKNQKGLQDALRGILDGGGDIRHDWELEEALQLGDRTTRTHVLMNLYQRMGNNPTGADLDTLWKELGINLEGGAVHFNDDAEMASIRRAITRTMPVSKR
jgi:hypothetical protein